MSIKIGKPIDGCMYPFKPSINYDTKIPINEMPESIEFYFSDYKQKILTCTEMEDEFIFEHLVKYVNDELYTPEDDTRIPKQLLVRALICFREEHKDEWNALMGIKEDENA